MLSKKKIITSAIIILAITAGTLYFNKTGTSLQGLLRIGVQHKQITSISSNKFFSNKNTPIEKLDIPTLFQDSLEGATKGKYKDFTFVDGKFGSAINFKKDSKIIYATNGKLNKDRGTIMFWTKLNSRLTEDTKQRRFFQYTINNKNYFIIAADINNDNKISVAIAQNELYPSMSATEQSINDWTTSSWHHIAITYSEKELKLYLDGKLEDTNSKIKLPSGNLPDYFTLGSGEKFSANSIIDEFKTFDVPLSENQINNQINKQPNPKCELNCNDEFCCLELESECQECIGQNKYNEKYIENENMTVGVSLNGGGFISHLSYKGSDNMINTWDYGREIQFTLRDKTSPGPGFEQYWNPTQGGNAFQGSEIIFYDNDDGTLYTKTRPYHFIDTRSDVFMEQWVKFYNKEVILVKLRVSYFDAESRRGLHEWPAVYLSEEYDRLIYYDENNDKISITDVYDSLNEPSQITAPKENWASLVDENGNGITIYSPTPYDAVTYAGFIGAPDNTTHMALRKNTTMNPGEDFEFSYYLIPGNYENARKIIYEELR